MDLELELDDVEFELNELYEEYQDGKLVDAAFEPN